MVSIRQMESNALPAPREALIDQASLSEHRPDQPLDLAEEHRQSVAAICNLHAVLDLAYDLVFRVAEEAYPDRWIELCPRLVTIASWVGHDLDGRSDIPWPASMAKRLRLQALQLEHCRDEARRLREEAERLLVDYRRKLGDVVTEVDNIIALAAKQAESLAVETRQSLKEHIERRIKLAEEKIARAEMEAVRELRNDVVDAAIAAAQNLIAAKLTPDRAKKLVSTSIKALKSKLN